MPAGVRLDGAKNLIKGLREFSADLGKDYQTEVAILLRPVVLKARGYVPSESVLLSGWSTPGSSDQVNYRPFPKFNSAEAKAGIQYDTNKTQPNKNGFIHLARIVNASASGTIYETAGRKNKNGRKSAPPGKKATSKRYSQSNNPNAGKQFVDSLNSAGELVNAKPRMKGQAGKVSRKVTGRLIYRAWAEDGGKTNAMVMKAVEKTIRRFESKVKYYA